MSVFECSIFFLFRLTGKIETADATNKTPDLFAFCGKEKEDRIRKKMVGQRSYSLPKKKILARANPGNPGLWPYGEKGNGHKLVSTVLGHDFTDYRVVLSLSPSLPLPIPFYPPLLL